MEQIKLHPSLRKLYYYVNIVIIVLYSDYKEYHTDTTVKFVVTLTEDKLREAQEIGIHKKFKLESSINTSNMVS